MSSRPTPVVAQQRRGACISQHTPRVSKTLARPPMRKFGRGKSSSVACVGVNTSNASGTRMNSSIVTCFSCDKKGHYATKCPEPRRTETPRKTSTVMCRRSRRVKRTSGWSTQAHRSGESWEEFGSSKRSSC